MDKFLIKRKKIEADSKSESENPKESDAESSEWNKNFDYKRT